MGGVDTLIPLVIFIFLRLILLYVYGMSVLPVCIYGYLFVCMCVSHACRSQNWVSDPLN